nr:MAG TPA: hypothetical protein [Caudoviricetes sp.]
MARTGLRPTRSTMRARSGLTRLVSACRVRLVSWSFRRRSRRWRWMF